MSKEIQYNPKEGRDCHSCAYNENKQGTAHKACMRGFLLGDFLPMILTKAITGTQTQAATYIDYKSAVLLEKEGAKQVVCTIQLNQWSKMFPLDYDPTWVVVCLGWSKERDERIVRESSPLDEMMVILGSVGRI